MGQLMSSGHNRHNNDELTNALVDSDFIHTENVEKVFRSVDRGFYFNVEEKHKAYRDTAYQLDKIHLSSPGIYAAVLESLELQKGQKFLNIGSGIGYFSTLAGLLLGDTGVNHGIEIDQVLINLAYQKMEEFKLKAAAIDHFQFCEPIFIQGNACELSPVGYYDRVYCGAGVPADEVEFMKSLIAIGGILVMPLDGNLLKVTRLSDCSYDTDDILDVVFTNLVVPDRCTFNTVKFPSVQPLNLQELCRSKIRSILREEISPNILIPTRCTSNDKEIQSSMAHFVRIQYGGIVEESLPNVHNVINSFVGLDHLLDTTSSGEFDFYDDSLPESEESDDIHTELLTAARVRRTECLPTTDESTKRKLEEPGCSEQKHAPADVENSKRIKMLSENTENEIVPSTSSQCDSDLWETVSTVSRNSILHDSDGSGADDFSEGYIEDSHESFSSNDDDDDDDEYDTNNDSTVKKYNFIFEYNKNEFSQLLKAKIDSLQLPGLIKRFLNYNRTD